MFSVRYPAIVAAVALLALGMATPTRALAHESRDVADGKYQLVVGFLVEPAFEAQKNGLDLRVRVPGTPATPVTGLEKSLQVEIVHVGSGKTVTKPIRAISAATDPGHYTADVLPSQAGQYRFRIFGNVESTQVNETFTSGEKFASVQPIAELSFPDANASTRSVDGAMQDLQQAVADAEAAADSARTLAIAALGVAVLAVGAAGVLAMRKG